MALYQLFKDGVLIEEQNTPDVVAEPTPEERIKVLEAEIELLKSKVGV